jgi:type II secretory pathway component PulF
MTISYDELAFVNRQLAGMIRDGVPMERGLKQICTTMRAGGLEKELRLLEMDLTSGKPLAQALDARAFPEFYSVMVKIGARTGNMAGMLTLLADYYEGAGHSWTRLKGLMVYPILVLLTSMGFAFWMSFLFDNLLSNYVFGGVLGTVNPVVRQAYGLTLWLPPIGLLVLAIGIAWALLTPRVRRNLNWRLPAFKEAGLARVSAAMAMLLEAGCPMSEAVKLLEKLENGSPAGLDLALWGRRCAEGHGKFSEIAAGSGVFPPLFVWIVAGGGEDLAAGFKRAAQAYQERAGYRTDMLLYAFLPASMLVLGLVIMTQIRPVAVYLFDIMKIFKS